MALQSFTKFKSYFFSQSLGLDYFWFIKVIKGIPGGKGWLALSISDPMNGVIQNLMSWLFLCTPNYAPAWSSRWGSRTWLGLYKQRSWPGGGKRRRWSTAYGGPRESRRCTLYYTLILFNMVLRKFTFIVFLVTHVQSNVFRVEVITTQNFE